MKTGDYGLKMRQILDCFLKMRGHYSSMAKELNCSTTTISNYMNSPYLFLVATKEELEQVNIIMKENRNYIEAGSEKINHPYYSLSKEEQVLEVIKLSLSGLSIHKIKEVLPISISTINRKLSNKTLADPKVQALLQETFGQDIAPIIRQRLKDNQRRGMSTEQLSDKLKDPYFQLLKSEQTIIVIKLFLDGLERSEISNKLPISPTTVYRMLSSQDLNTKEYQDLFEQYFGQNVVPLIKRKMEENRKRKALCK